MMTKEEIEVGEKLEKIFMPLAYSKREEMRQRGGRFVHYTSAENAIKIISTKRIWLRNARCMNDYMESYFGHRNLVRIFQDDELKRSFIDTMFPFGDDMGDKILQHFDSWWKNIQFNTYISSLSLHDPSENDHGRLSMWRAYGGNSAKAALILRVPLEPGVAGGLKLLLSPVEYFTYEELEAEFKKALQSIRNNTEFLSTIDSNLIFNTGFFMLVLAALCLKHQGFREEKEWRVIYLPHAMPSENLERSVEVVGGVPQVVYKIPLENKEEKQIQGVSIPDLIERMIIGPSVYPTPILDAFSSVLMDAGIPDPHSRLVVSDIPLRT